MIVKRRLFRFIIKIKIYMINYCSYCNGYLFKSYFILILFLLEMLISF